MRVVLGRLYRLQIPNAAEQRPRESAGALFRGIKHAELQWIHPYLRADFVYDRLHGECSSRRSGRTVGGCLGLIEHHVKALYPAVGDVVGTTHTLATWVNWRARIGAGLVGQGCINRSDTPVFRGAQLASHPTARGWARALENFRTVHTQLHWLPGLPGQ